jgi:hypothetical protein
MKTSFYGPISKLDITKERIRELEDMWTETSQTEKQREKRVEKWNRKSKNYRSQTMIGYWSKLWYEIWSMAQGLVYDG